MPDFQAIVELYSMKGPKYSYFIDKKLKNNRQKVTEMSIFIVDDLLINLILLKSNSPIHQGNFLENISQLN